MLQELNILQVASNADFLQKLSIPLITVQPWIGTLFQLVKGDFSIVENPTREWTRIIQQRITEEILAINGASCMTMLPLSPMFSFESSDMLTFTKVFRCSHLIPAFIFAGGPPINIKFYCEALCARVGKK